MSDRIELEEGTSKSQQSTKNKCFSLEYDGVMFPPILPCEPKEHFSKLKQLQIDSDDVAICSYPKSGTHWLQQMIHMLKKGSTDKVSRYYFFDSFATEKIQEVESPRVWASHFRFSQIPSGFQRNTGKVIYLVRNPKDVAVSLYTFIKDLKLTAFKGSFSDFWQLFIRGNVYYSSWFDHVKSWMKVQDAVPNAHVLYVYYENLTENCFNQMKEIADFLEVDYTNEFLREVIRACEFKNMKTMTFNYYPNHFSEVREDGTAIVFRKGQIDDWKNWFTAEQLEEFEILYKKKMMNVKLGIDYLN